MNESAISGQQMSCAFPTMGAQAAPVVGKSNMPLDEYQFPTNNTNKQYLNTSPDFSEIAKD